MSDSCFAVFLYSWDGMMTRQIDCGCLRLIGLVVSSQLRNENRLYHIDIVIVHSHPKMVIKCGRSASVSYI